MEIGIFVFFLCAYKYMSVAFIIVFLFEFS